MKRFKTPSVVQFEATECGAVSLYIILGYYEKWMPLEEIRSRCKVGRDGANLANTAKAAQSFDLDVELFQFEPEELEAEFKYPCIVFWNNNHFLVVEGFSKNSVYLSDPARGRRKISKTEFTNSFSRFCIFLEPNRNFIKCGQQPSLLKRLMQLIGKNNTPGLLLSFLLGLQTTLPTLGISAISTYFTDTVLTNMGSRSNGYIWILLLLTFLTMLSTELMYMINRRLQTSINEGILDNFFRKIFTLPVKYYSQRDLGELANRVTISSKLSVALTGPLTNASVGATQIIVYSLALLFFSPWLTLLLLSLVILQIIFTIAYMSEIDDLAKRSSISNGRMASSILYMTSNSEQVKGNGLEGELFSQWSDSFAEFTNSSSKTSLISQYSASATAFLTNVSDYLVIGAGGALILNGKISIADFVGMRILTQGIFSPLGSATAVVTAMKTLTGDVGRLFDVFDNSSDPVCLALEDEIKITYKKTILDFTSADGMINQPEVNRRHTLVPKIHVKDLSFAYNQGGKPIFDSINLDFPAGSVTAICGPSGCGKSTLLRILAGIVPATSGELLIGNTDINKISREQLLNSMSFIDTEIYIMNDTVMNNVTLMDPSYGAEDVIAALKKASMFNDVARLPAGIEHTLQADGDDLSGGQKQRIQLARAFLRLPLITIIDEATSALDNQTERQVIAELVKLSTTLIAATHRPGLLSIADQIIFLSKEGAIEGIGTFVELSQRSDNFRSMFCGVTK